MDALEGVIIKCLGANCGAGRPEMHLTFFHRLLAQTFNKSQYTDYDDFDRQTPNA